MSVLPSKMCSRLCRWNVFVRCWWYSARTTWLYFACEWAPVDGRLFPLALRARSHSWLRKRKGDGLLTLTHSLTFPQTIQTDWEFSQAWTCDGPSMLTCSGESPPRQDTRMWRQRWTQVRPDVDLSGLRRYHLGGGDQLPDERKAWKISHLTWYLGAKHL